MKWYEIPTAELEPRGDDGDYTISQLSSYATEGRNYTVNFEVTKAFLKNCERAGEELLGEDDYDTVLLEYADDVVPYGDYDRWLAFTDLKGWESDDYYEALEGGADREDSSAIAAYVLNKMAFDCISQVARGRRDF